MLEAEVVVEMAGNVLLHAEERLGPSPRAAPWRLGTARFRGFREVAFASVVVEGHSCVGGQLAAQSSIRASEVGRGERGAWVPAGARQARGVTASREIPVADQNVPVM